MQKVTLGGDRLGSGNKQKISMHGFERSTHDLGFVWRNTQAPGTLVPFLVQLALPGDTFDIDLNADVKTHPTLGPLFASFKLQLDVFECPIRLYHSWLHNNKLKIGNDMSTVKLPQLQFDVNPLVFTESRLFDIPLEQQQINQSSLMAYLGVRGIGQGEWNEVKTTKNAIPFLGYWDIYKNYYANKQEEIGMMITSNAKPWPYGSLKGESVVDSFDVPAYNANVLILNANWTFDLPWYIDDADIGNSDLVIYWAWPEKPYEILSEILTTTVTPITGGVNLNADWVVTESRIIWGACAEQDSLNWEEFTEHYINDIKTESFPLEAIDEMRESILQHNNTTPFFINKNSPTPYGNALKKVRNPNSTGEINSMTCQESLAIKTYQSDIFNNWLNTEWLDGEGGINEITAISTEDGSFDINTLNLAQKVYDMLNRIAVSGGTYEDWLTAVYDHSAVRRAESPIYHGGLSKEIIFQEVVSTAAAEPLQEYGRNEPLGTLAGRGKLSGKHKGGHVSIRVNEPSYIIGIVSITPRIDYYQGNEFFTNHMTMNDLHKPSLDQIGFQDLVTDKMAFWDTVIENEQPVFKSAGKQPAWLDYMTNFNKLYGNFADERNEMFMTLARRYQSENNTIKDLTSYIDPTKYNYAFAQTDLTAQNFWVQIGADITARRKMSAKLMPNL